MTPDNKEKFSGLSSRQESLEKRTGNLAEKLEMLSQLFPGMDTEILNDLKDATDSMGKASGRLEGRGCPGCHSSGTGGHQKFDPDHSRRCSRWPNRWPSKWPCRCRIAGVIHGVMIPGPDGIMAHGFLCPPFHSLN